MASSASPIFQAQTAEVAQLYDQWKTLSNGLATATPAFGNGAQPHIVQDTFTNMVGASHAFVRFMEFWQPVVEAAQKAASGASSSEAIRALLTAERYKPVMDSAFDFATPERLQEYLEQLSIYASQAVNAGHSADVPPVRRRVVTRSTELLEQLLRYAHSFVRYRDTLYAHGLRVAVRLAEELVAQPSLYNDYGQFFSAWIRRNEDEYATLFRTQEFIALQNTLSGDVVATHGAFQRLMETLIEDSPLATRSQMDALHKAVHDLKRDVRMFIKSRTVEHPATQS
jgi:hypothetical protein